MASKPERVPHTELKIKGKGTNWTAECPLKSCDQKRSGSTKYQAGTLMAAHVYLAHGDAFYMTGH